MKETAQKGGMVQSIIASLVGPNQVVGTRAEPTSVTGKVEKSLLPQTSLWPYCKFLGAELLKFMPIKFKINQ